MLSSLASVAGFACRALIKRCNTPGAVFVGGGAFDGDRGTSMSRKVFLTTKPSVAMVFLVISMDNFPRV
jgi:hypothetical protein